MKKRGQATLRKRGQATLELALSFIVLTLFLLGIVRIMFWFGNNLGGRARYYQTSRPQVIAGPPGAADIDYQQSKLSLFND